MESKPPTRVDIPPWYPCTNGACILHELKRADTHTCVVTPLCMFVAIPRMQDYGVAWDLDDYTRAGKEVYMNGTWTTVSDGTLAHTPLLPSASK